MAGWDSYNSGLDLLCPEIYACGDYNTQMLLPNAMKSFQKGYIFGSHMQASYHNMTVLHMSGIDRITVLLRDPRDAFISWVHHLKNLGVSARNYHSKIYHIPESYFDWSLPEQFDFQVRTFLSSIINWVEGWLDYYASSDKKIDVQFVYFDQLKRDPESYCRNIVKFHNIKNADFSKVITPEEGKFHFRKGEHGQWKVDLSEHNQRLVDTLLQDRIVRGFERAAQAHPGMTAAGQYHEQGNFVAAANKALEVIEQFSSCRCGYALLLRVAALADYDTQEFNDELQHELGSLELDDYFLYNDTLVKKAQKICQQLEHQG